MSRSSSCRLLSHSQAPAVDSSYRCARPAARKAKTSWPWRSDKHSESKGACERQLRLQSMPLPSLFAAVKTLTRLPAGGMAGSFPRELAPKTVGNVKMTLLLSRKT